MMPERLCSAVHGTRWALHSFISLHPLHADEFELEDQVRTLNLRRIESGHLDFDEDVAWLRLDQGWIVWGILIEYKSSTFM
jgi:hypothetical protein